MRISDWSSDVCSSDLSSYQNHVGPAYVKAFCPRSRTACKVQSSDKVLRSRSASIRKLLGLNSQSKVMGASNSCRQIVQVRTERSSAMSTQLRWWHSGQTHSYTGNTICRCSMAIRHQSKETGSITPKTM